jgi:hypothetical protein
MPDFTAKDLEAKSLEELAVLFEGVSPLSAESALIRFEFQKRAESRAVLVARRANIIAIIATTIAVIALVLEIIFNIALCF